MKTLTKVEVTAVSQLTDALLQQSDTIIIIKGNIEIVRENGTGMNRLVSAREEMPHTLSMTGKNSYLAFDGGVISKGFITGIVDGGVIRPEWFGAVGDGVTDDSDAIEKAIVLANYNVDVMAQQTSDGLTFSGGAEELQKNVAENKWVTSENISVDYYLQKIIVRFSGEKSYLITRYFSLSYGVSLDGGGCCLLPHCDGFSNEKFLQYDGVGYVFGANVIISDQSTGTSGNILTCAVGFKKKYPATRGNFIRNFNVGNIRDTKIFNLGFVLLAEPMIIEDIVTNNICPVVDTLSLMNECYLDAICIRRVRANYLPEFYRNCLEFYGRIAHPYVISKRCRGDSMVIDQLVNECSGNDAESQIWGVRIHYTDGLTICNSIHPDGVIFHSVGVSCFGNHYERLGLRLSNASVSIRDCFFYKPADGAAIVITEYGEGALQGQRMHSVSLENIYFAFVNNWKRSYLEDYPEISILGKGNSAIYYRNIIVTTTLPTFDETQCKTVNGLSFGFNGKIFHTAFKDGRIDFANGTPHYMDGRVIAPKYYDMNFSKFQVYLTSESEPSTSDVAENVPTISKQLLSFLYSGTYVYTLYMVNDLYGGRPLGKIIEGQEEVSIEGGKRGIVEFSVTPEPIDGCFVILKRTCGDNSVYVRMPVSCNGYFVDCGNWINGYRWVEDSTLVPPYCANLKEGEYIEIDESGRFRFHVRNLLTHLNWAGSNSEQIDMENPLRCSFGKRNVFYHQPFLYLRQTEQGYFYHISHGYDKSMYEDQIYTIRNGKNDTVVEIRIQFKGIDSGNIVVEAVKTVRGSDFITAYRDCHGGLYLCSSILHTDLSIQTNQVNNLVAHEEPFGNSFPWETEVGSDWTLISLSAPSGSAGWSSSRPTNAPVGTCYFDQNLGKPIWLADNSAGARWVDAMGNIV